MAFSREGRNNWTNCKLHFGVCVLHAVDGDGAGSWFGRARTPIPQGAGNDIRVCIQRRLARALVAGIVRRGDFDV